jgi:hypothetical protein
MEIDDFVKYFKFTTINMAPGYQTYCESFEQEPIYTGKTQVFEFELEADSPFFAATICQQGDCL